MRTHVRRQRRSAADGHIRLLKLAVALVVSLLGPAIMLNAVSTDVMGTCLALADQPPPDQLSFHSRPVHHNDGRVRLIYSINVYEVLNRRRACPSIAKRSQGTP
jgi:hypothetical protein